MHWRANSAALPIVVAAVAALPSCNAPATPPPSGPTPSATSRPLGTGSAFAPKVQLPRALARQVLAAVDVPNCGFDAHRRVAVAAARAGDHRFALELLEQTVDQAARLEFTHDIERAKTALTYARLGLRERATAVLAPLAAQAPDEAYDSLIHVAAAQHALGDHRQAKQLLDRLRPLAGPLPGRPLPVSPKNAEGIRALASGYGAIGDHEAALALLQQMPIVEFEVEALLLLANDLADDDGAAAFPPLQRAIALTPRMGDARRVSGWTYRHTLPGNPKAHCLAIMSFYDQHDTGPTAHAATVYARLGKPEQVARLAGLGAFGPGFAKLTRWIAEARRDGAGHGPVPSLEQAREDTAEHNVFMELCELLAETLARTGRHAELLTLLEREDQGLFQVEAPVALADMVAHYIATRAQPSPAITRRLRGILKEGP